MNVLTISKLRKVSIVPAPFGSSDCGNNSQVGFSPSRKLTSHLKLSLAVFLLFLVPSVRRSACIPAHFSTS